MPSDSGTLAFELHALTARLDRAADRLLRSELGITYRRFLVLFMVRRLGADSQRDLAERLDVSEPSVSRMTGVLSRDGLLDVAPVPGSRRHALRLTAPAVELLDAGEAMLAERLGEVMERSRVPLEPYLRRTRQISAALDAPQPSSAGAARRTEEP